VVLDDWDDVYSGLWAGGEVHGGACAAQVIDMLDLADEDAGHQPTRCRVI
jgi:hypothetical protein